MEAQFATRNNDYMINFLPYDGTVREQHRGTCMGWNHGFEKMVFAVDYKGKRIAVGLDKKEHIKPVE